MRRSKNGFKADELQHFESICLSLSSVLSFFIPNHVHGIVWIAHDNRSTVGAAPRGRPDLNHNINQIYEKQPREGRQGGLPLRLNYLIHYP